MIKKIGRRAFIKLGGSALTAAFLSACGVGGESAPVVQQSATDSPTAASNLTPQSTASPEPTATEAPTVTPTEVATPTPQPRPDPTPSIYVDSQDGDDENDGSSPLQAFRTLDHAMEEVRPGSVVGLARGSHFREKFVSTLSSITIIDYGEGERPIIDCADLLDNNEFERENPSSDVYQISIEPELHSLLSWINVWENEDYLLRAASVQECATTPGTYFVSADTGRPPVDLYIHATDSADIRDSASRFEVSSRQHALNLQNSENAQVVGIETRRNLHVNGSVIVGPGSLIQDCVFRDGNKHSVYVTVNCNIVDCQAINAYCGEVAPIMYYYHALQGGTKDVTFVNCSATSEFSDTLARGFGGDKDRGNRFNEIRFTRCSTSGLSTGFNAANDANLVLFDTCRTEAGRIGFVLGSSQIFRLQDCTILGVHQPIISRADGIQVEITRLACIMNLVKTSVIFIQHNRVQFKIEESHLSVAPMIAEGRLNALRFAGLENSVISTKNTFSGFQSPIYYFGDSVGFLSDLNCFSPYSMMQIGDKTYRDFDQYISETGQDRRSNIDNC